MQELELLMMLKQKRMEEDNLASSVKVPHVKLQPQPPVVSATLT